MKVVLRRCILGTIGMNLRAGVRAAEPLESSRGIFHYLSFKWDAHIHIHSIYRYATRIHEWIAKMLRQNIQVASLYLSGVTMASNQSRLCRPKHEKWKMY
ncbi:hypothetical protein EV356DRAFT_8660 [Viridothelium virens]|uniref:Uncharacterized protein n=1 Tax=Viridothelium virens TaxID=1048519 RepID=A0A6A6HPK3_VIRVR|nr:hypothetical protein EV356DRAFT_8660 [Viridothelium virens]